MSKRMAIIISGGLTAFILVFMGVLAVAIMNRPSANFQGESQPAAAPALPSGQNSAPADAGAIKTNLTPELAARIAALAMPGARLTRNPELVNLKGQVAYEVTLNQGVVYVDANNGTILYSTANPNVAGGPSGGRPRENEHEQNESGEQND